MADSIMLDPHGPDWPLGLITVLVPGTPVRLMSLVDPSLVNAPWTIQPPLTTVSPAKTLGYSPAFQQIMFQGFKKNLGADGVVDNTGNIYVCRAGVGAGLGNRDDYGALVLVVKPGQTVFLASAPANMNVYSPYRYFIDADNPNDGCIVTGYVG